MANRFGGTKNAPQTKVGAWFKDGTYIVDVRTLKYEASKNVKKKGVKNFIGEFTVVESTNAAITPGMVRTQIIPRDPDNLENPKFAAAEGDINNLCLAVLMAMGASKADIDSWDPDKYGNAIEALVGQDNPAGRTATRLKLVATTVKTSTGGDFTKHEWEPVSLKKAA